MSIRTLPSHAFTDQLYRGNPAAVCFPHESADPQWMQAVAAEMNLAETAFLSQRADGTYDLRWFTPKMEVDLCGHATLASAHTLWECGDLDRTEPAQFHTRSGLLTARAIDQNWIELDFPTLAPKLVTAPRGLTEALAAQPQYVGEAAQNHLIELESAQAVRALEPDFSLLGKHNLNVIATAVSDDPEFDFISPYFAVPFGINEDPATGSTHCTLGPYWQSRLHKNEFVAYQASARGGVVKVRVEDDRTLIAGQAVTVLRGELTEPALAMLTGHC